MRSPSVCRGEWVDGKLEPGPDWVHTGDLATIEPTGSVRIRGRLKSLIKRGGIRILPAEIERALCAHPEVLEAKVVGIRHPRLGEVPKAYIVPVSGGAPRSGGSLASFCLDRLRITSVPVGDRPGAEDPQPGSGLEGRLIAPRTRPPSDLLEVVASVHPVVPPPLMGTERPRRAGPSALTSPLAAAEALLAPQGNPLERVHLVEEFAQRRDRDEAARAGERRRRPSRWQAAECQDDPGNGPLPPRRWRPQRPAGLQTALHRLRRCRAREREVLDDLEPAAPFPIAAEQQMLGRRVTHGGLDRLAGAAQVIGHDDAMQPGRYMPGRWPVARTNWT